MAYVLRSDLTPADLLADVRALSFAVASRRREFGVRRALGATTLRVMKDVASEGLRLTLVGCALGLGGALVGARLLQSQLYVVRPSDPIVYAASLVLIVLGAAVACWIPGRRATTISPMDALRVN